MSNNKVIDGIEICEENRFSRWAANRHGEGEGAILEAWKQWFSQRGIPSVICKHETSGKYALFRNGLIHIEGE